jgi:hypothetical protein
MHWAASRRRGLTIAVGHRWGGEAERCDVVFSEAGNFSERRRLSGPPTARLGEEKVRQFLVGEERHKERPSSAMVAAAASPCDSSVVVGLRSSVWVKWPSRRTRRP